MGAHSRDQLSSCAVTALATTLDLTPLLEARLATTLECCAPWHVAVLGPDADPDQVRAQLLPWIHAMPHESGMPLQLVIPHGMRPERGFPWPATFVWPAQHPWQPLLQPWIDPGFGTLWVELLGEPDALLNQATPVAHRLYEALVLDPAPSATLLWDTLDSICDRVGWDAAKCRSLAQDCRPLQRDREMVQVWIASEVSDDPALGEHAGRSRMFLSLHMGSGPLHYALLPRLSEVWSEAVLDPRELSPAMIAALPRSVPSHQASLVQQACGQLGAVRRLLLLERLAEVIHESAWELQVAADPSSHQAWCGVHRVGDRAIHRWGWQRPDPEAMSFLAGGLGQPGLAITWVPEMVASLGPLLGLPAHLPRRMESRDALRHCTDWSALDRLQEAGVVLRAGSKGLLRTHHPEAFASNAAWRTWLPAHGLVSECHPIRPVATICG